MKLINRCREAARVISCSRWFIPAQTAVSALAIAAGWNVAGSMILITLTVFLLLFSDDTLSAICPVMFTVMTVTSFYNNYLEMVKYAWVTIPVAIALIVHIIAYRGKPVRGRFLFPFAAVSAALLLGGVGTIPVGEYFSGVSIYHMLGLGAGLLLLYLLVGQRLSRERGYDTVERFASLLYGMAIPAAILILRFYVVKWSALAGNFHTPFISYRNLCTTVMLFGMPMPCLFVRRTHWHLAGLVFIYSVMIVGGSRSGLLFGTLELIMCLVCIYVRYPQDRKAYRRIAAFSALPLLALGGYLIYVFFISDGGRFANYIIKPTEARVSFYPQGVRDFLDRPVFGWGIGNMKNTVIYEGVPGSISFYHNSVLQALASLGVVGGAAYMWQFIERVRLLRHRRGSDGHIMIIPYISVLLMSQTNPGLFCPLPTALLLMLMFAVLEYDREKV